MLRILLNEVILDACDCAFAILFGRGTVTMAVCRRTEHTMSIISG